MCRFGMGKEQKKELIGRNCGIVSTLYYASPPCKITAMNWRKNQTRYISHIYEFRLACHFPPQKWLSKVSCTLRKYIESVYVQVRKRFVCGSEQKKKKKANNQWLNFNSWTPDSKHNLFNVLASVNLLLLWNILYFF